MKILVIGGGNMGLTYATSFLNSHITSKSGMMILERSEEKASVLKDKGIASVYTEPGSYINDADLIILAVKPQDTKNLFNSLVRFIDKDQVILSIMAGITVKYICNTLGVKKVIRAMPNMASQIGQGMTVFTSSDEVTRIELVMVQNLINTTGKSIYTSDEKMIDAATAISGSGPAYVLYFMSSLIKAAMDLGFSPSEAELLVSQTFRGTVDLFNRNNLSVEKWINMIASKGGTTEAALDSFNHSNLDNKIQVGAKSAFKRATELGKA